MFARCFLSLHQHNYSAKRDLDLHRLRYVFRENGPSLPLSAASWAQIARAVF
jgi:hypothetical protein